MSPSYWPWCSSEGNAQRLLTIIRIFDWRMPADRYVWPRFVIFRLPGRRMRNHG